MALATDIYFPALAGTRRPITARFTSNNEVETAGVVATATLLVYNVAYNLEDFTISFGSTVLTFTAKTSPSHDTGVDLPTGTVSVTTIAGYFDDNYLLTLYYDITVDVPNSRITFTAKQPGAAYTLSFGGYLITHAYSQHANTAGVDEVRRPNFQAWADLYIEPTYLSGDFSVLAAKLSATRSADGGYYFDVSAIVDAYTADYPPTYNDNVVRNASNWLLVRYLIKTCEAYGSPITPGAVSLKTSRTALRGRMPIDYPGTAGNTLPYFSGNPTSQMLSLRPTIKRATKSQNEFLYFLSQNGTSITITSTVYFTDGTTAPGPTLTPGSGTGNTVHVIPAGYEQLGIGSVNPAKVVDRYIIGLTSGAGPADPIRYTFNVMDTCPPHIRYLVFRNELGGYDTLQLHGALLHSGQAERQRGQYILPENYTLQSRQSFDYDTSSLDEYELHTGYHLTKEEAEYYLRQILMSENVLLQDVTGFTPVTLSTKEANYTRDKFNLYGMALKLQRSLRHGDQHTSYRT